MVSYILYSMNLLQPTISLEMPVPSQGHCGSVILLLPLLYINFSVNILDMYFNFYVCVFRFKNL